MLTARSGAVREGADVWVILTGPPNKQLSWSITGPGTLSNMSTVSDVNGIGQVMYTPGSATAGQAATIEVTYRSA